MLQSSTGTPSRSDTAGTLTLPPRREARLRPEHARFYPGIIPGIWESAAVLADRVLAAGLLRGVALGWCDRVLREAHFEFRGGTIGMEDRPRREDR
jgi:hypothetical protein